MVLRTSHLLCCHGYFHLICSIKLWFSSLAAIAAAQDKRKLLGQVLRRQVQVLVASKYMLQFLTMSHALSLMITLRLVGSSAVSVLSCSVSCIQICHADASCLVVLLPLSGLPKAQTQYAKHLRVCYKWQASHTLQAKDQAHKLHV